MAFASRAKLIPCPSQQSQIGAQWPGPAGAKRRPSGLAQVPQPQADAADAGLATCVSCAGPECSCGKGTGKVGARQEGVAWLCCSCELGFGLFALARTVWGARRRP